MVKNNPLGKIKTTWMNETETITDLMTTNTDNKEKNIAAKEECGPEKDQKKDRRIYILSQEKPSLAVVKLGVPLIAGMFIMVLYNLVDTYFIGLMRDDYQLAAVNLAYPVMMISIAISNMIGTGASSLIARSLGAEDGAKARHTLTVGFELTIFNSLLVTAVGMVFLSAIVRGLGAQSNTFEFTRQYVQVILLGRMFTMGNYTF